MFCLLYLLYFTNHIVIIHILITSSGFRGGAGGTPSSRPSHHVGCNKHQTSFVGSKYHGNAVVAGASSWTLLRELTALQMWRSKDRRSRSKITTMHLLMKVNWLTVRRRRLSSTLMLCVRIIEAGFCQPLTIYLVLSCVHCL